MHGGLLWSVGLEDQSWRYHKVWHHISGLQAATRQLEFDYPRPLWQSKQYRSQRQAAGQEHIPQASNKAWSNCLRVVYDLRRRVREHSCGIISVEGTITAQKLMSPIDNLKLASRMRGRFNAKWNRIRPTDPWREEHNVEKWPVIYSYPKTSWRWVLSLAVDHTTRLLKKDRDRTYYNTVWDYESFAGGLRLDMLPGHSAIFSRFKTALF